MLTGTHQRLALVNSFTVRAGDTVLSRVYLGVMLDPYLLWNDHIDYIGCKISAKLGMLRKVRKVIPRESCLTLNNAMKLPVFDYCAVVWYSCSKADREYLDKPHRRAASIIEGYTVSQSQISHTFGWPTLHSRRDHPTSSPGLFPHDQKMGGAGKGPGIGWSRVQPKYSREANLYATRWFCADRRE